MYSPNSVYGRVVELYALPYAYRSRAEYYYFLSVRYDRLILLLVGRVKIGYICRKFACAGVYHLIDGHNAFFFSQAENIRLVVRFAFDRPTHSDVFVAESHLFGLYKSILVHRICLYDSLELYYILYLLEEKHIYLCGIVYHTQVYTVAYELGYGIEAVIGRLTYVVYQIVVVFVIEFFMPNMANTRLQATYGFKQAFAHSPANRHHFARSFHLSTERVGRLGELVERETRYLGNYIVESRFETCRSIVEAYFVESKAHCYLGTDTCYGIAACFRRQGRTAAHTRIDLYEIIVETQRVESKLYVAATLYFQGTDDFQRRIAKQLKLFVCQCLRWANNHRVASMNTDRVDVFHITDSDGGIVFVTNYFVFNLFEAFYRLFNQYLMYRREGESITHQLAKLGFVFGKTSSRTSKRKRRTQHDRVADFGCRSKPLFHRIGYFRRQYRFAQTLTKFFEKFAVFCHLDTLKRCTEYLHIALFEDTFFGKLYGEVEPRLPAKPGDNGIGSLETNDFCHIFQSQRLHIDLVGYMCIGHNSSRVRVCQYHLVSLFFQSKASLCSCIVELRRLPYHYRSRADYHYLFYVCAFHYILVICRLPSVKKE